MNNTLAVILQSLHKCEWSSSLVIVLKKDGMGLH